jgi:D-alanine-D-alanine ligase
MMKNRKRLKICIAYNETDQELDTDPLDVISEVAVKQEALDVFAAAEETGHEPSLLPIRNFPADILKLSEVCPDVIFNLCEGFRGKAYHEMHLAGVWELLDIPYTGNTSLTLGLAQDKVLTKKLLESRKIPTPLYQVFSKPPENTFMEYPLIVKPASEDASLGINQDSVIHDFKSLQDRVRILSRKYNQPVLVEKYIEGREFNISVLGGNPSKVLPVSEISFTALDPGQPKITCYEAKWLPDHPLYKKTPPVCPAKVSTELEERLKDIAMQVFKLLHGRDYGRIDVRVDARERIFVLEFNPNPDISVGAGFANAVKASGMTYPEFVNHMIENAINRRA